MASPASGPRLKKAAERLDGLRGFAGMPLPAQTMAELRRLLARHRLLGEQLREIEAERDRVAMIAQPDPAERMIQPLARIVGLGLETATLLVREMLCRPFGDRRAPPDPHSNRKLMQMHPLTIKPHPSPRKTN